MLGIRRMNGVSIDLWQGDMTEFVCDAMVNAANTLLIGGGGIDGAIHRVGGPVIAQACYTFGGCPPGQAVVTPAGNLPCQWIIHAVGPVWRGGQVGEAEVLRSAYESTFAHAAKLPIRHLAISAISTGAFGFPAAAAAEIAIHTAKDFLAAHTPENLQRMTFVLFTNDLYKIYQQVLFTSFPDTP